MCKETDSRLWLIREEMPRARAENHKECPGSDGSELHLFRDHSSSNVENVLEVVQAAGWEISHWRVMLSGNDGSRGKDSKRDS